jgi:hypothetical protein
VNWTEYVITDQTESPSGRIRSELKPLRAGGA